VLLVGAGAGITPVRAMLEELPQDVDVVVVLRGSSREDLLLRDEVADHVARRGGRLHEVVGPRERFQVEGAAVTALIPDVAQRDVYLCGPEGFQDRFAAAVAGAGVPATRIHSETFAF
jgi:ferredoxin-NADP reductase